MISVIIPLYNKAPYITKCLESVASQTYREFEVVVVDDGSTDGSVEAVSEFQGLRVSELGDLAGFRLIRQENAGVSVARNNGVKEARFDFIAFLDADDWWEPDFLLEMKSLIIDFPDAGVYGCRYFWLKNGVGRVAPNHESDLFRGYLNYIKAYTYAWWMPLTSISVVIRKDVFVDSGGFNPKLKFGEDFDLWIRLALQQKIAYSNRPLAYYNQDVSLNTRALGTGKHWSPEEHFIFNLDYLYEEESRNPELKELLDGLRVRSLVRYRVNNIYKAEYKRILALVNLSKQSVLFFFIYKCPLLAVQLYFHMRQKGSMVKQFLTQALK
jgi:glycosyltransferase involved in cell wall biosynthesis